MFPREPSVQICTKYYKLRSTWPSFTKFGSKVGNNKTNIFILFMTSSRVLWRHYIRKTHENEHISTSDIFWSIIVREKMKTPPKSWDSALLRRIEFIILVTKFNPPWAKVPKTSQNLIHFLNPQLRHLLYDVMIATSYIQNFWPYIIPLVYGSKQKELLAPVIALETIISCFLQNRVNTGGLPVFFRKK